MLLGDGIPLGNCYSCIRRRDNSPQASAVLVGEKGRRRAFLVMQSPILVILEVFTSVLVGVAIFFEARLAWRSRHRRWGTHLLRWRFRFVRWSVRCHRTYRTRLSGWKSHQTHLWGNRARSFIRRTSDFALRVARGYASSIEQISIWVERRWVNTTDRITGVHRPHRAYRRTTPYPHHSGTRIVTVLPAIGNETVPLWPTTQGDEVAKVGTPNDSDDNNQIAMVI